MIRESKVKTIILRLLKWIASILVILCVILYFLNQGIKSKYCGFRELEKDSIETIIIYSFDRQSFDHHKDSLLLTTHEINKFVRRWNNSYPIGPCKYIPSYILIAKMKNGTQRHFRTTQNTIKEYNDFGYRFLMDDNYFERIWNKR